VATYARSKFEDTRRKAIKFSARRCLRALDHPQRAAKNLKNARESAIQLVI